MSTSGPLAALGAVGKDTLYVRSSISTIKKGVNFTPNLGQSKSCDI